MKIDKNWVYTASFYAKMNDKEANSCGPKLSIQLITEQEPRTKFVDQPITSCLGNEWQKFEVKIQPSASARNVHNAFAIQFTSTSQSDEVVQIAFASLFPPTFNDRPNGVRIDLAEVNNYDFFLCCGNQCDLGSSMLFVRIWLILDGVILLFPSDQTTASLKRTFFRWGGWVDGFSEMWKI